MKLRLIGGYILEIAICLVILVLSISLWQNFDLNYSSSVAKSYENYPVINQE
jgi:hypothetical protein